MATKNRNLDRSARRDIRLHQSVDVGIGLRDSRFGFVLSAAQPIDWVNAALMLDRQLRFPHYSKDGIG
jgi:hypothetical protein